MKNSLETSVVKIHRAVEITFGIKRKFRAGNAQKEGCFPPLKRTEFLCGSLDNFTDRFALFKPGSRGRKICRYNQILN